MSSQFTFPYEVSNLYEGSIIFNWPTQPMVVTIILHLEEDVLEVAVFDPSINTEANRLYIDGIGLSVELGSVLDKQKEKVEPRWDFPFSSSRCNRKSEDKRTISHRMNYIIARLQISTYYREKQIISLRMANENETLSDIHCRAPFVISKPSMIYPFRIFDKTKEKEA